MSATLYCGDVRAVLAGLPERSVQTVVTSPPYWGLRDYGTASWEGGDAGCDHIRPTGTILGKASATFHGSNTQQAHEIRYIGACGKCGARRVDNQLGLERTPEEYVANMVAVFREVRRVLRDDGTLWLNLGDSYAANRSYQVASTKGGPKHSPAQGFEGSAMTVPPGMKPKDLVGIPWAVAFALRADGWYLRSETIWSKPNPMPESVTDRPTKSHEQVFLLSKSPTYYYDAAAIAEPVTESSIARVLQNDGNPNWNGDRERNYPGSPQTLDINRMVRADGTRNARSVWTIATQPYPGAHFATFPEELARRCILAGSAARACEHCGAPWERVTERTSGFDEDGLCRGCRKPRNKHVIGGKNRGKNGFGLGMSATMLEDGAVPCGASNTLGWAPTCACEANTGAASSVVLDPFGGSGTTAAVAVGHGRRAIYIDLNPSYLELARDRIGPMLCEDAPSQEVA